MLQDGCGWYERQAKLIPQSNRIKLNENGLKSLLLWFWRLREMGDMDRAPPGGPETISPPEVGRAGEGWSSGHRAGPYACVAKPHGRVLAHPGDGPWRVVFVGSGNVHYLSVTSCLRVPIRDTSRKHGR